MADDTYHPRGSHPEPSGMIPRTLFTGSGAPSSTAGVPPNSIYLDEDNGNAYKLENGEWVLKYAGGGGGGVTQVFRGSGDPNGVQSASGAAFYWDDTNDILYFHNSNGTNNTNWIEILAA